MTLEIAVLPNTGCLLESAISCYTEAFSLPPYSDPNRGREVLTRLQTTHRQIAGYRAFIAVKSTARETAVGLCYGYKSQSGQWWHETVRKQLDKSLLPTWFDTAYELVEIAVLPSEQGQGIGTQLISTLLAKRPEPGCLLSTRIDSRAYQLYERLGFSVLGEIKFTDLGAPYYVMGKVF